MQVPLAQPLSTLLYFMVPGRVKSGFLNTQLQALCNDARVLSTQVSSLSQFFFNDSRKCFVTIFKVRSSMLFATLSRFYQCRSLMALSLLLGHCYLFNLLIPQDIRSTVSKLVHRSSASNGTVVGMYTV